MSKKPFRIDGPGEYKDRTGRVWQVIKEVVKSDTKFIWETPESDGYYVNSWDERGFTIDECHTGNTDLVSRVTPTRTRKVKAQWCVVVPCKDRKAAHELLADVNDGRGTLILGATVRRIGGGR